MNGKKILWPEDLEYCHRGKMGFAWNPGIKGAPRPQGQASHVLLQ